MASLSPPHLPTVLFPVVVFILTKQMFVSGTMSERETTSSLPERVPELFAASSASKLPKRKKTQYVLKKKLSHMKKRECVLSSSVPVISSLILLCVCCVVHFHTNRTATKSQSSEYKLWVRRRDKNNRRGLWTYRSGGEMEATPVLPNDGVEKSAGLSSSGGVLGTRSGLPCCTPKNKEDGKTSESSFLYI